MFFLGCFIHSLILIYVILHFWRVILHHWGPNMISVQEKNAEFNVSEKYLQRMYEKCAEAKIWIKLKIVCIRKTFRQNWREGKVHRDHQHCHQHHLHHQHDQHLKTSRRVWRKRGAERRRESGRLVPARATATGLDIWRYLNLFENVNLKFF